MAQFECTVCGFLYDEELGYPDGGIEPETEFKDLPENWYCPFCTAEKDKFKKR